MGSTRNPWLMVAAAWLLSMATNIQVFAPSPLVNTLMLELKLTYTEVGQLLALPPLMYVLLSIFGGFLADRWSMKKVVGLGAVLVALGGVARGLIGSKLSLFAFTLVAAAGIGLVIPNLPKFIASWFPPARLGLATGLYVTTFALGPAVVFAITSSIMLPNLGGWQTTLLVYGLFAVIAVVGWWLVAEEQPKKFTSSSQSFKKVLRVRDIWFLGFITSSTNMLWYGAAGWLPYTLVSRGFNEVTAGLVVTVFTLAAVPALVLFPLASDYLGTRKHLIWIPLLTLGPLIYVLPLASQPIIWPLSALFGIMVSGVFSLMFIVPVECVGLENAGGAMGIVISTGYIGGILGPWLVGYLKEILGVFWPGFLVVAIVTEIATVLALVINETGRRVKRP